VHLANEAQRQRKAASKAFESVVERRDVAADFARIFQRRARLFVELVEQEVGERGFGALDHRREHGLLADKAVENKGGVGQQVGDRVEAPEGD
jgi:hypothetical protein